MKKLSTLLENINILKSIGNTELNIEYLSFDSRDIKSNTLFFAIKGTEVDGHKFIDKSIENGARVIICEEIPSNTIENITYIKVENSNNSMGVLAKDFYDNTSKELNIIGVTGTNGKTTIATLLYELFSSMGEKSGLISTIKNIIGTRELNSTHTTPDIITINKLFREMVNEGCKYCFMEVSSHGISQGRINNINFKGGIFTNITHDHLDYHKTFKNYLNTKKLFFDNLSKNAFSISNMDDKNGTVMLQNTKSSKYYYALKSGNCNFKAKILESNIGMQQIILDGVEFYTPLNGEFNVYNLLAIYSTAILCEKNKEEVLISLSRLNNVRGRFETFISDKGTTAIVDYSHTPNALKNILSSVNKTKGDKKIITVVGCGGNRDKEKRPIMAKIATENSDEVILTSDNSRNERPKDILNDMEEGISSENFKKYTVIEDRKEAIKFACKMADKKTIILIAGKGHETYQEINGNKSPFDDMQITKDFLAIF